MYVISQRGSKGRVRLVVSSNDPRLRFRLPFQNTCSLTNQTILSKGVRAYILDRIRHLLHLKCPHHFAELLRINTLGLKEGMHVDCLYQETFDLKTIKNLFGAKMPSLSSLDTPWRAKEQPHQVTDQYLYEKFY